VRRCSSGYSGSRAGFCNPQQAAAADDREQQQVAPSIVAALALVLGAASLSPTATSVMVLMSGMLGPDIPLCLTASGVASVTAPLLQIPSSRSLFLLAPCSFHPGAITFAAAVTTILLGGNCHNIPLCHCLLPPLYAVLTAAGALLLPPLLLLLVMTWLLVPTPLSRLSGPLLLLPVSTNVTATSTGSDVSTGHRCQL
jgi:hypothetical protein